MLFHLFCMFYDYRRIARRSQDSAGKSIVKRQYFGETIIDKNYSGVPIFPEDEGSEKEEPRRAAMGPPHRPARAPAWPRRLVGRGPTTPSGLLSSAYLFAQKT